MKKLLAMYLFLIFGLVVISTTTSAEALKGIHPLQSDRFVIGLGGFAPDLSGEFSVDSSTGEDGTDVDFQDDMGLDDSATLPAAAIHWRLSNKSRIQGEYFNIGQSHRAVLGRDINIGDVEFEIGADLKSDMRIDIARVFYGYSFVKNDKAELGAGAGLHYINMDISVSGQARVNGIETPKVETGVDEWAILPNVGAYANYAFSPKWITTARVDWISVNIDKYSGGLWNVEAALQYQMLKHVGIGLAYRYIDFNVGIEEDGKADIEAEIAYSGPMLFFTANF